MTNNVHQKVFIAFQDINAAMYRCDWPLIKALNNSVLSYLEQGYKPTPFLVAILYDSPALQKKAVEHLTPLKQRVHKHYQHSKIRVGYLSADFCEHATSYLFLATLQHHNHQQFDIYLYDYSTQVESQTRKDVLATASVHRPIHHLTDQAAAALIEADEIDILVDMKGQIYGARADIVRYMPAQIIINYLAYPATNGSCCDYVITDKYTFSQQSHFYEKPLFLPYFYLPFSNMAPMPSELDVAQFKAAHGLSDCSLILGCLNSAYKITESMAQVWKAVLQQYPQARFLLLETTPEAKRNILAYFAEQAPQVIFLPQTTIKHHMIRMRALDLFCDSFPVCAHTVALDAAYVGTPLLALSGLSYITRVSSSVNRWMELDELNTNTIDGYTQKILMLCAQPEQLKSLRLQVQARSHIVLNQSVAQGLEQLYTSLLNKASS